MNFSKYNSFNNSCNQLKNNITSTILNNDLFDLMFSYSTKTLTIPRIEVRTSKINNFFEGFNNLFKNKTYDENLNYIIDSIDIYGFGLSFMYVLNQFYNKKYIVNEDYYTELFNFFDKMCTTNPVIRITDIEILLNIYENTLLNIGVLTRLNKHFDTKHNLINGQPITESLLKLNKNKEKFLSKNIEILANLNPIELSEKIKTPTPLKSLTKTPTPLKSFTRIKTPNALILAKI